MRCKVQHGSPNEQVVPVPGSADVPPAFVDEVQWLGARSSHCGRDVRAPRVLSGTVRSHGFVSCFNT